MDATIQPGGRCTKCYSQVKELLLTFGDYVEVHEGTENTSRSCSLACVALYLVGNATGSLVIGPLEIETWCRVRKTNMVVKLVTSDLIKRQ
jgi:hypothetical protein